jgi:hypothetical protein
MSDTTSILSYLGVVLGVGSTLLAGINHRRVRSSCCGIKTDVSIDIEDTTPPGKKSSPLIDAPARSDTDVPATRHNSKEDS